MTTTRHISAVFTMARIGLAELAKNYQNGPSVIAEQAALLEEWRAAMEKQVKDQQTDVPHA